MPHIVCLRPLHPDAMARLRAEPGYTVTLLDPVTPETLAEPTTTVTETMDLGEFATQIDRTLTLTDRTGVERDLSDDEIERAIEEIQSTIQRYRR